MDQKDRADVMTTKLMLQNWMRNSTGPNLRTVLEALAENCEDVAAEREEHFLSRDEAVAVWRPTAERIRAVGRFVEESMSQIPNREIPKRKDIDIRGFNFNDGTYW